LPKIIDSGKYVATMPDMIRIILDLNGVVQGRVQRRVVGFYMRELLGLRMTPAAALRLAWAIARKLPPDGFAEADKKHIRRFYESSRHITIGFLPGAKRAAQELLAKYPVHICSANKYTDETDRKYMDYLTAQLGNFEKIYFVPARGSKMDFYASMRARYPGDDIYVIDDSPRHIEDATKAGLIPVWINKKRGYKSLADAMQKLSL